MADADRRATRRRWAVGLIGAGALVLAGVLLAPRALSWQARRACIANDLAACVRACRAGVGGSEGCFGAGQQDEANRRQWYVAACRLGDLDGCRMVLSGPRAISGDDDDETLDLAERGCALGHVGSCRIVGDSRVDRDPVGAAATFGKLCAAASDAAARKRCERDVAAIVKDSARLHRACDGGDARACAERGKLLVSVAPVSAVRSFAKECELRGIHAVFTDRLEEDCGGWIILVHVKPPRTRTETCAVHLAESAFPRPDDTTSHAKPGALPLPAGARVHLQSARDDATPPVDVRARVEASLPRAAIEHCYAAALERQQSAHGRLLVRLVVDALGEVFRVDAHIVAGISDMPPSIVNCISTAFRPLAVTSPPGRLERLTVEIAFESDRGKQAPASARPPP